MSKISVERCRKLIGGPSELPEPDVCELRDVVYVMADAVAECFSALDSTNRSLLYPPGDVVDCLNEITMKIGAKQ